MDAIAKADIFFVVATVGTVVFIIIGTIVGIYVITLLREAKQFTKKAKIIGFFIKRLIAKI